ncbi:conserved hypothetical protein [delta proteobacterium NaphS2]|nr:conserved hypothetical protein [delta proteobacterium NaphS2]
MPKSSIRQMLLEGQAEVKELFEFVKDSAATMNAYTMERSIYHMI